MTEVQSWITAIAAVVGAVLAGYAALVARKGRKAAEQGRDGIIEVDGKVYKLDKSLDGALSKFLEAKDKQAEAEANLAHAEGVAQGEQAQRDRQAPPAPNGG